MSPESSFPWSQLSRTDISKLVLFHDKNHDLNEMQTTGCHALWNTLCKPDLKFAYLADEVGLGKTYQALGIVGILQYLKPSAKVLILCPGKEMQRQWSSDWHSFFQQKYCPSGIDCTLKGLRIDANSPNGEPTNESCIQPHSCDNLQEFASHLVASNNHVFLLRYSSFSTPLRVFEWRGFKENINAQAPFHELFTEFMETMKTIGCFLSQIELEEAKKNYGKSIPLEEATTWFHGMFVNKVQKLIRDFAPDLVIWDEAQYLRTDANRNDSLRKIFGPHLHENGCRHLFLSATPAHRDIKDIEQLNHLFSRELIKIPRDSDFRTSVEKWMVRREREFNGLGKLGYRRYERQPVDLFDNEKSPMYALTFAVMQKQLVHLLDGKNNRFRMGEISSNESTRSSIKRHLRDSAESILEESSEKTEAVPIDEQFLDHLGTGFKALQKKDENDALDLPHAKVDQIVERLSRRCLARGSSTKEVVFVRRIDTVDELTSRLLHKFQKTLDQRIVRWGIDPKSYWKLRPDREDDHDVDDPAIEEGTQYAAIGSAEHLPYFKALSAVKGNLGRLTVYRNTLGKPDKSVIRFLLAEQLEVDALDKWRSLLDALGCPRDSDQFAEFKRNPDKELLLRRCLAHSIRFTDILVDLDILRQKYPKDYITRWMNLLASGTNATQSCKPLHWYFCNVREKLRAWIDHFDVIVNKCFKDSGTRNSYGEIAERVAKYFAGLSPVACRSGRHKEANVLPQFKFPIYPNILICTDVLREGVNLHLFCERVSHYGIAWNSGDLEQRIGRVERADSLFERMILKKSSHKLPVFFPFLSGTLDERQVTKALNQKKRIDALFDIIPPKETGECSDSAEKPEHELPSRRKPNPILPIFTDCPPKGEDWLQSNSLRKAQWADSLQRIHNVAVHFQVPEGSFHYHACRMLGDIGLIAVEWERLSRTPPQWNPCEKLVYDTFGRRKQWKTTRTLYLPHKSEIDNETLSTFWNSISTPVSGSSPNEHHLGFTYCYKIHTHLVTFDIPHPFGEICRSQSVQIRKWGDNVVLCSEICNVTEVETDEKGVEFFVSDMNKHLPFGWATVIQGRILLCLPMFRIREWGEKIPDAIVEKIARWADRQQWKLMNGKDDDEIDFNPIPVSGICEMNTSEAIKILRYTRMWCIELNNAFENALGNRIESGKLSWQVSSFNKIIENGKIDSICEMITCAKNGKFQIGYVLSGLTEEPGDRKVTFYLSGKAANERVVPNDNKAEIEDSVKGDYESWLEDNEFTIHIDEPEFHYACSFNKDGKEYRRVRIVLPANECEVSSKRREWVELVLLTAERLIKDIFRFNQAKENVFDLLSSR